MSENNPSPGHLIIKPSIPTEGYDLDSRPDNEIFGYQTREQMRVPMKGKILSVTYFPQSMIVLDQECQKHPDLVILLAAQTSPEIEDRIAEIAAYCGVLLDGMYTPEDIDKLCDMLITRLQKKRMIIL
jgi:hypothetical protein